MSDLSGLLGTGRVTASPETLMKQAGWTAAEYLDAAVEAIDERFGEGYAKKNPTLVAAFMQAAALDYQAASVLKGLEGVEEAILECRRP